MEYVCNVCKKTANLYMLMHPHGQGKWLKSGKLCFLWYSKQKPSQEAKQDCMCEGACCWRCWQSDNSQILLTENSVLVLDRHVGFPWLDKEAPGVTFLPVSTRLSDGLEVVDEGILTGVNNIFANLHGLYWT